MAAYASLSSLAKTIHHLKIFLQTQNRESSTSMTLLLSFPADEEQQLRQEIESLVENIDFLRAFLEKHHHVETDTDLEAWIRDAANRAEDIIGSFLAEQHWSSSSCNQYSKFADDGETAVSVEPQKCMEKYISCSHSKVDYSGLCHEKLHRVTNDISLLVCDIKNNIISKLSPDDSKISYSSSPRQIENTSREEVVGLGSEYHKLMYRVIHGSYVLKMVPIIGKGGMGKTTLARMLFNDPLTLERFQIRGWVTVSKNYRARDILISLVKSIQPFIRHPKQRYESLENHLQRNLKGRSFLIVLDDVWSGEALDFLMRIFPDDENRSRIVLTTRHENVAVRACPVPEFIVIRLLTATQSRDLLMRKVFKQEPCPDELKDNLTELASRCRGRPLLIVLVAGILRTIGKSELGWSKTSTMLSSLLRIDDDDDESESQIYDNILLYSYRHLPRRLRSCLLYMGAFPEDHEINVSKLTKLWLAQGFLLERVSSLCKHYQAQAEECLQQLVDRNLVSVPHRKSDGKIKSCSLHDIVRDFLLEKAREEGFFCCVTNNYDDEDPTGNRMQIAHDLDSLERICRSRFNDAHAIMSFGSGRSLLINIGRFRLLKTLYVMNVELKSSFPLEIIELFLLRFLAISHVPELPSSISNLKYLETLIIHPIDDLSSSTQLPCLVCLPSVIWKMPQLRHLVSFCWGALPNLEGESSVLENLETLSAVMNLTCDESVLRLIPNVKKLGIFYFGVGRATHSLKNLEHLHGLEKLKLCVMVPFSSPQILDLGYPAALKKLNIGGIRLSSQDMKFIGALPNLQVLKLRHDTFEGREWRVDRGGFSKLKHLLLEGLDLMHWASDDVFFLPILRTLVIRACTGLREIPEDVGEIGTLELIEVIGGNKFMVESARRLREKQRKTWNPRLQIVIKNQG